MVALENYNLCMTQYFETFTNVGSLAEKASRALDAQLEGLTTQFKSIVLSEVAKHEVQADCPCSAFPPPPPPYELELLKSAALNSPVSGSQIFFDVDNTINNNRMMLDSALGITVVDSLMSLSNTARTEYDRLDMVERSALNVLLQQAPIDQVAADAKLTECYGYKATAISEGASDFCTLSLSAVGTLCDVNCGSVVA
jgi:hypothetical protein